MTFRGKKFCYKVLIALVGGMLAVSALSGADHRESPDLANSAAVGTRDINDVYVFKSPTSVQGTVMILTVNPFSAPDAIFDPRVSYDLLIDNNGDTKPDVTFRTTFSPPSLSGAQDLLLRCTPAAKCGQGSAVLARGATGTPLVFGDEMVQAGLFDDPFFFDLDAFSGQRGRAFCDDETEDFFAGFNTLVLSFISKSNYEDFHQTPHSSRRLPKFRISSHGCSDSRKP